MRAPVNELDVNVERASPDLYLPTLADWHERSAFVARFGPIDAAKLEGRVCDWLCAEGAAS